MFKSWFEEFVIFFLDTVLLVLILFDNRYYLINNCYIWYILWWMKLLFKNII